MSFVTASLIGAGGAVVGGLISGNAATSAAGTQAAAANRAADLQNQQYYQTRQDYMPWLNAGEQALSMLVPLATNYTPFSMAQFQADPGYGFRMSEGMKALERSAAARGGLLSGATLKGIQRFGQDLGSQEYQNAFNRYQTERAARLQPLQSLAGVGQTTAQQLGQAGQTMASNVGEALTSGAAARASGYVGQANALAGALGGVANAYMQGQMLNRLMPAGGGGGYNWQTPSGYGTPMAVPYTTNIG
jgi:hypothetical protein